MRSSKISNPSESYRTSSIAKSKPSQVSNSQIVVKKALQLFNQLKLCLQPKYAPLNNPAATPPPKMPMTRKISVHVSSSASSLSSKLSTNAAKAKNIFSSAIDSLGKLMNKDVKRAAKYTMAGIGATINLPFLVTTGSISFVGRKISTNIAKPVLSGLSQIKDTLKENSETFKTLAENVGALTKQLGQVASTVYEMPSYAIDKLDSYTASIDKQLGQINDDSISSNFKYVGLGVAKFGLQTLSFVGDLVSGTLYSMTVGNLVDTANSFEESGIVMEDYMSQADTVTASVNGELKDLGITAEDSPTKNQQLDTLIENKKLIIKQKEENFKSKSLSDRVALKKEINSEKKELKKLERTKKRFAFSRLSSTQKFAFTCDQLNETTAALGNSLWNIGFVGSTVCPPLSGISALGGCLFLGSKATNVLTNALLRSTINSLEKEALQEKIIDILQNSNADVPELMAAIQNDISSSGTISPENITTIPAKINQQFHDLTELTDTLDKLSVTTQDQSQACKNALKSTLQIANWALLIYGAGTAGGALMSGESVAGSFEAGGDHIAGMGSEGFSTNTVGAQFDMSSLGESLSQNAFEFTSDPALIGDILTEYPLFYLEGKYLSEAVDKAIENETKLDSQNMDLALTSTLQMKKNLVSTILQNDNFEKLTPADRKILISVLTTKLGEH